MQGRPGLITWVRHVAWCMVPSSKASIAMPPSMTEMRSLKAKVLRTARGQGRSTPTFDYDLGVSCEDHLAGDPADAHVAGSAHIGEHPMSRFEVAQRLPVPRSAARVQEAVLVGDRPAGIARLGPAEDHVEVPAVARAELAARRSSRLVLDLVGIE